MNVRSLVLCASAALSAGLFGSTVSVVAPQVDAAKTVTVANKQSVDLAAGVVAPLKATANAGWVFAGWYECYDAETGSFCNEAVLANFADWRSPSANYVVGNSDVTLYAKFVQPGDDRLTFDLELAFEDLGCDFDDEGRSVLSLTNFVDSVVEFDSVSLPTVTISGLPSGLAFDKTSLRLIGRPTTPGVFRVTASAKNASGYQFSQVFYLRVENAVAEHVEGIDCDEIEVGDEVDDYLDSFFAIVNTNASIKTVSVTGLPSGLALASEREGDHMEYYIRGTVRSEGVYLTSCTVVFSDGTSESATMLFTVNGADPVFYEGDVDFTVLDDYSVGDSISAGDEVVIGRYDGATKLGVTSVSGLPSGISAVKRQYDDGTAEYLLVGTFAKAGEFSPVVKVAYEDWESESIKTVSFSQKVVVLDSPGVYLKASVLDADSAPGCKVVGSGVYPAGSTAKLTATAASGYVFAGWCDYAGMPRSPGSDDFRKTPASIAVGADVDLEWYASFLPKSEDYISIGNLNVMTLVVDTDSTIAISESFVVDSGSFPTLKFTNLPAGISCSPSADMVGEYVISYDPAAAKKPAPGKYKVTATGTNLSRQVDTATFEIIVLNYLDEDIDVLDDYGVLTPNVPMTPISFSNVVDFARGDTLTVSGLPAGLKYNDKSAPFALSGTPTKPGNYTLTFSAKIVTDVETNEQGRVTVSTRTGTATAFITVKDFPTVSAVLDDDAARAGNKVAGTGSFKAGAKTTLKATAAKGWVFGGGGESSGCTGLAALNPSLAYVVGTNDMTEVEASFIEIRDDTLFVADPGVVAVAPGVAVSTNLVETLIETRSMPTVSMAGLPMGLKFDAKTYLISGTVGTAAKPGYYYATLTAKNAGGYTFTRVLKFVVLDSPKSEIPDEPELANEANIDFSALDEMYTGDFCPADGVDVLALYVDPSEAGADVTAVTVSGLPSGLKSAVSIQDGMAEVLIYGTPTKPGRCTLKLAVTYADRSRATSEYAFIVQDGGSSWLDVDVFDPALGTVTGSGVYASGATVKLSARPANGYVFAGWYEDDITPFAGLSEMDGVDYRTAASSFVFRRGMFQIDPPALLGDFVAKADDSILLTGLDDVWEITPDLGSWLEFDVESASLPKLTVTGLPKGCTLDAAGLRFCYPGDAQAMAQIVPGYYTVTIKAVNQSNVSATAKLTVFVANKATDAIGGLDPAADAYPIYVGATIDPTLIMPEVDVTNGWKLTASGLPAGLSLKSDKDGEGITYYYVAGVATKAATNTVTFTATSGTQKEIATVTVMVSALPEWANGTYDGAYCEFDEGVTNAVGQVTATVSAAGKITGKILKGGKTYSFSAASYEVADAAIGVFAAEVVVPWSTSNKETFLLTVEESENGLGSLVLEPVDDGHYFAEAVQNVWLRKDFEPIAFATGTKQPVLAVGSLTCKFAAKGVVNVAGTVDGVTVSGKAQATVVSEDVDGLHVRVTLYFANAKFAGGAACIPLRAVLSDEDGDGLLDCAVADPD